MRTRRLHIRLAASAVLTASAIALAPAPVASAGVCHSSGAKPGHASKAKMARATICLINSTRRRHGLRSLRLNRRLSRAATRHAGDMVRQDYFAHDSLTGASFVDRIRRSGYLSGPRAWVVGENLAWGSGDRSSAAAIVRAWMNSPPQRANILQRRFRSIGIGLAIGAPGRSPAPAATYDTDFGARS